MATWNLQSWRQKINTQSISYSNQHDLEKGYQYISHSNGIVNINEIKTLNSMLALVQQKKAFIIQAGDCAETFSQLDKYSVTLSKLLTHLKDILFSTLNIPTLTIGRMAGQFAKPRSHLFEESDNISLPTYRGDLVNSPNPTIEKREPNPNNLTLGYNKSQHIYNKLIKPSFSNGPPLFTSHEALHLLYEEALTKKEDGKWYNLATHFPWVGVRTNNNDHAHVEYLRGLNNPIGIKLGPHNTIEWFKSINRTLNPENLPGKLTFITRLGSDQIEKLLPRFIETALTLDLPIIWLCDPMHGNTQKDKENNKVRYCDDILKELLSTLKIHNHYNSFLGGIHLEVTTDLITECHGWLTKKELETHPYHKPLIDPRLNVIQATRLIKTYCDEVNNFQK